ncbi:DUF3017 domain-containing protein [Streptomyces fragilis]|uniref:DUF3017 domain-containing protein n=1 Tax=Streptomyces fragilis TaxID=67301 RepID=A0ABV2YIE5_9ACTN|nr:DUF3017 domain-containing protein [Streptomyces fragilis]
MPDTARARESAGAPDTPGAADAAEVPAAAEIPDTAGVPDPAEVPDTAGARESAEAPDAAEEPDGADGSGTGGTAETPVVRDAVSAPDAQGRPRRVTRRFPLFTRDTARPEGGGRAAPKDAPAPARQWPILLVSAVAAIGLLLTAFGLSRAGTVVIGCGLLLGATLRWAVPNVGILAVRSRFTDVVTYGLLGAVIVLLALMVEPSRLELPFLKDLLHFTVDER